MQSARFATIVAIVASSLTAVPAISQTPKPDLVVLIAIDQFGSQLFNKWRASVSKGLKHIASEGIIYSNAFQSHGVTETCPGHSTLLTGKHPGRTGIVANEWFDAQTGKEVYCVADSTVTSANNPQARKVGPGLLATDTLGDWLKAQEPESRVVAVSGKDRASITMGGHQADAVFWYEDNFGFTTFLAAGQDAGTKLAPVAALNSRIQAEAKTVPPWTYLDNSAEVSRVNTSLAMSHGIRSCRLKSPGRKVQPRPRYGHCTSWIR